jgi:hypothetical protein
MRPSNLPNLDSISHTDAKLMALYHISHTDAMLFALFSD